MKTISALAVAVSLALGSSLAMAPLASAATAPKATTGDKVTCSAKDKKNPCPVKHVAKKPMHKKHKVVASKTPVKTPAKTVTNKS